MDLGDARHDDDAFEAKVALVVEERVAVVSFTFGCPERDLIERLHKAEAEVWVTVTSPDEAVQAAEAGADALVAQGLEAGGHRGSFTDIDTDNREHEDFGLLALLRLLAGAGSSFRSSAQAGSRRRGRRGGAVRRRERGPGRHRADARARSRHVRGTPRRAAGAAGARR